MAKRMDYKYYLTVGIQRESASLDNLSRNPDYRVRVLPTRDGENSQLVLYSKKPLTQEEIAREIPGGIPIVKFEGGRRFRRTVRPGNLDMNRLYLMKGN